VLAMDKTLGYLREILSNYTEKYSEAQHLYRKLTDENFTSEGSFVRQLNQEEMDFLNKLLPNEIKHAKESEDHTRAYQLNEVYELIF
jgi:hypothetical protein